LSRQSAIDNPADCPEIGYPKVAYASSPDLSGGCLCQCQLALLERAELFIKRPIRLPDLKGRTAGEIHPVLKNQQAILRRIQFNSRMQTLPE
jgi:hypothetical protein